jgi:hypothetical protein
MYNELEVKKKEAVGPNFEVLPRHLFCGIGYNHESLRIVGLRT